MEVHTLAASICEPLSPPATRQPHAGERLHLVARVADRPSAPPRPQGPPRGAAAWSPGRRQPPGRPGRRPRRRRSRSPSRRPRGGCAHRRPCPAPSPGPGCSPPPAAARAARAARRRRCRWPAAGAGAAGAAAGGGRRRGRGRRRCPRRPPAAAPGSPMRATGVPTGTVSPDCTRISSSTPSYGLGISESTLSVDTSNSGSSNATASPTCLSQVPTVPSVTVSPSLGMVMSCTSPVGPRPATRGRPPPEPRSRAPPRSRPSPARPGRTAPGARGGPRLADAHQRCADRDRLPRRHEDLQDHAVVRARDLRVDLVRGHLEQRVVERDGVADLLEPAVDHALGHRLAQLGHRDGPRLGHRAVSRLVAQPCRERPEKVIMVSPMASDRLGCAWMRWPTSAGSASQFTAR